MTWPGRGLRRLVTPTLDEGNPVPDYLAGLPGPPPMPPEGPSMVEMILHRTERPCAEFLAAEHGDTGPDCIVCGWPEREHPSNTIRRAEEMLTRAGRASEVGEEWAAEIAAAASEMDQRKNHGPFTG